MGSTLHILVVDDRPDSVLFLTEFLLSRRHRVETCNHAAEALEAIVRRHRTADTYDLLISDVSMPGMDGLTLLKEIRRRQMLLPVALYTAYGSMHPNLAQQAQQHGCLMVLDKPIELRRVENLLDDVAARRSGTARQDKDQPFFGTSRVARTSSTTTAFRRETAQPGDLPASDSGGYALEPKPMIPLPPSQPMVQPGSGSMPLSPPQPPRIPPPIRTPLPFPIEQQEPHTRSMPSFRTPLPQDHPERRDGTGRTMNSAFRTPLPFLQSPPPMPPTPNPVIPPNVASAPPVRTPSVPTMPTLGDDAPPQPSRPTTSFIRRGINATPKETGGYTRRPSGFFLHNPATDPPQGSPATSRIRRTVTGSYVPSPLAGGQNKPPQPPQPPSQQRPTAAHTTGNTRAVACAHCHKVFMVASRAETYTAVCVHCGQLNRIDPL